MAKRKKVVVINKEDIKRGFEEIKKESAKMGKSITSDADKIKDAFDSLSKRAKGALNEGFGESSGLKTLNDVNEALQNQRTIVNDLEVQLRKAKAEFDNVNIGTANPTLIAKKKQASTAFKEARVELDLENQQLEKQEKAFKILSTELSSVTQKSVSFTTQMRNIRDEMREMALDGKSNTPEYEALRVKLDEVAIAYNKVADEQRMMTKHGSLLIPGMMQGLTGLAGGFSAYHGAVGLFTKDNERLMEIQTKIQGAMSITMGLQQVNQTLLVNSAFRVGVVEKVTKSWTVAQNALNTSLGISKGLAGAFMTGGILALVAGVGYVVTSYRKWAREQERLKIIQEDFNKTMLTGAQNAQKDIVNLDFLYKATQDHNRSQAERLKAARELQRLYPDYLGNLSEEQILAGKGADAYNNQAEAIIKVARAQAAKDKIYENEKKRLELQDKLEKATKKQAQAERDLAFALKSTEGYGALNEDGTGVMSSTLALNNVKNEISSLKKQVEDIDSLNNKLKDGINIDDWISGSSSGGGNKSKDRVVSILDDIENARYNLAKQATQDKLELLKLEEEQELKSINKKYENAKISEEQKKELIDLTHEYYKLKAEQIQKEEFQKEQDKLQKEQEAREKSLEAFETYEVQKQAIIDKYAELRKNATEKHDVSLIDKAEKEELEGLDDKFKPKLEARIIDLTRAKVSELIAELDRLRGEISKEADPKVVESLQNRIDGILNKLQTESPFVAFKENIKEAFEGGKVDFTKLGNAIDDVLPSLQAVANDARALFGDDVGDSLDGFLQAVDGFSDLSKSIGAFSSGDIMGGVAGLLSAGNKLFGNARKVNAEHREALRLLRLQKQEIENQVALSELRAKLEGKINIFGTDKWGQTKEQAKAYLLAKQKLDGAMIGNTKNEAEIAKLQAIRDKSHDRRQKTALTDRIKKLQEEQKSTLEQMQVVNGSEKKRVGLFRKKRVDTWGSILDEYDDLVNAEGKLNIARAEAIMQNAKMKDEDKVALQDLIDNAHIMEDAYIGIANNLKDTFGELGQTIMDAFAEASKSGINDFSKIEEAGGKMLEKLANEMIFNAVLGDLMDDYTKQMTMSNFEGLSDKEMFAKQAEIMDNFIQGAIARQDMFNQLQESSKNTMIEAGYTPIDNDKQDSSRGVQRNVSQDTMDEVNGRFTAVQISNESIAESTRMIAESSRRSIETMSSISNMMQIGTYAWQDIANYTSVLPGMAKTLESVKRNTDKL